MTSTPRPWRRPNTDSQIWERAARLAHARGVSLNAAKTEACARRHGRYWLQCNTTRDRLLSTRHIRDVIAFLETYRPATPSAPIPAPSWLARTAAVVRRAVGLKLLKGTP